MDPKQGYRKQDSTGGRSRFLLSCLMRVLQMPVGPDRQQNKGQTSSDLQGVIHEIAAYKFRIIYPADFFICIDGDLPGVLEVPDDGGKGLVHHLLGQVLPQGPFFVFPAVLPDKGFHHQDGVELRGVDRFCLRCHRLFFVV